MTRIWSGVGPMNVMPDAAAGLGKLRVLGKEPVAGMDCVGTGDLGGRNETWDAQIGVAAGRRADAHVVVGKAYVQRLAIRLGIHGDRLDIELTARTNDAQRDFAAIGNQDLFEHVVGQEAVAFGRRTPSAARAARSTHDHACGRATTNGGDRTGVTPNGGDASDANARVHPPPPLIA